MKIFKKCHNSEQMALQTAVTIEEQDVGADKRVPLQKTKRTKTLLQILLALMGLFALGLICYQLCSKNSGAENETRQSTETRKESTTTRSSRTLSTRPTPPPKKKESGRETKNMDKDPIYCRMLAAINQMQTSEARVVWSSDERNSFCSHDLGLSDDGQNITVYQRGVYEVSFKTCVLCDDENGTFVPVRSEMTLYRNGEPVPGCSVVKYGPGSLQGTCSLIILLENDVLSVRINSNLWSRDLTSLDLYLRTRKLY